MGKKWSWHDAFVPDIGPKLWTGPKTPPRVVHGALISNGYDWECAVLARDGKKSLLSMRNLFYRPLFDSLRYCLRNQEGWDPFHPPTRVAQEFLAAVRQECSSRGLSAIIGLFRSVGTVTDQYHSADAFFMTDDNRVALVDLTINERKIVHKNPDCICVHPEDVTESALPITARRIADIFMKEKPLELHCGTEYYLAHRVMPTRPGVPGFDRVSDIGGGES